MEDKAGDELADAWVERYGPDAAEDGAALEQRGLVRLPFSLLIQTEADAAVVVGAVQLRRDTARRIREQAEQMAAQADREADRIEEHFLNQLQEWTAKQIAGTKAKSVKLITGQGGASPAVVGFRRVPGGLRIVESDKAIAWAKDHDDDSGGFLSISVVEKPVAAEFKRHFEQTGEVPAGCEVTEETDKFYVKA